MYHEQDIICPYCGESITAFIDLSQGNHHTIEDCWVCCRPIEFLIEASAEQLHRINVCTDDESVF